MKHLRQVEIPLLGTVTVEGASIEQTLANVRVLPGEPPLEQALEEMIDDQVPPSAYKHPALARQIVLQAVEPRLTLEQVLALPGEQIRRLLGAIDEAHPETRRLRREKEVNR